MVRGVAGLATATISVSNANEAAEQNDGKSGRGYDQASKFTY